jgi:ankyrin repeat protein
MASPSENDSPLHSAVRQGELEEVRRILDEPDVNVNCVNSNHETPLHLACALDHSSIIEILIVFGANAYMKDSDSRDCTCYGGMNNLEICNLVNKLLWSQNLWLEGPTYAEKDGPLHYAVKLSQLETVQDILDHKRVGINDKNSAHETPLHIACATGDNGIVHKLIINGASMCERDSYNNAPIHRAAAMGHTDIVDMIVTKFGCDPAIRGYQGRSLLHFACGSGNIKLFDMLVQRKFLDPVNDRDACGLAPLHIAALCGHEKIIDMLIGTFHCPVDCQDGGAHTPLHLACISGHISTIKLLVLKHNANLNVSNFQTDLPLHLAAQFGHTSVVQILIVDFKCNPNATGFRDTTILHRACRNGHVDLAETLIANFGLDPMCVDHHVFTPLHYAAWGGYLSVVEMLVLQYNADFNAHNKNNDLPLHLAVSGGHTKLVKAFINDLNCNPNEKGCEGRTILHEASVNGHVELAETLITDFGIDPMCVDDDKNTPLHYAAWGGHPNVVNMLVSRCNANVYAHNYQNDLPVHIAAVRGHTKLVKAFISDFNCNPCEKGFKGRTILHEASVNGHVELAETLITDFGLDPMCVDDDKYTPLHYAAWGGHFIVVGMLVSRHNANLNARNNQNQLPLHLAASKGHTKLVKAFINDFNCNPSEKGFERRNILHEASVNGHIELTETLITDFDLDAMCMDDDKNTSLHYAALGGHLNVVDMLVTQYNVDVNARNNQNELPLHLAAVEGHIKLVKAFINDFNCNPNEKGFEGRTILHEASDKGYVELTETLITDFGLDPMCVDDNKYTPLHYAAYGGHLSVVKILVSRHNVDINACNNQADSPLQLASREGHTDVVKVMIDELNNEAKLEGLQSRVALTAFSQACREGHQDLAVTLITDLVCLSPLSADRDGNTLLHIAAMYEEERCVALLLHAYNAPVYVRNNAGKIAREVTKSSHIREIFDSYLKQNIGNIQDNYKQLQLLSSKRYSGEQRLTRVFVVGNTLSGKSTLIESMKREGFFTSFGQVSENTVPLHTSGIIPSVHDSKTIGRILYYDFAGDPQYYSSHSAILSNVSQSKVGTNIFMVVLNFNKTISTIQEELGYWLCFISYHSKYANKNECAVTVMVIGSHIDHIASVDKNRKLDDISKFTQAHFSKISPGPGSFKFCDDILTLNCRQPRSAQGVRDAIFQISKDTQPFNLSPEAAILLGLLEKDFKNVITCNIHELLAHIYYTHICLPTSVVNLYPVLEQLHDVGLLMIIGRHSDKLEDHIVLLNISKLTNEVHELLFSNPTVDDHDHPNLHVQLSMGVLPQRYLNDILPVYITSDCLVQLEYCQSFDHFEVKFDHLVPANHECNDSTLFYFPALCKSERKESIVTPDGFNYHIGYFTECKVKLEYFPPRFLHLLFLRLAYSYALQAAEENTIMSDMESVTLLQKYNHLCTMWKNGIHWLMQEGVECFVESVNNSKAIVVITKSKEEQKSTCSEMLFKILREFQQVKDEICETVALQQYILDSDNPSSCNDKYKLFKMSQVEQVLREGKCSVVSVNGKGHMDAEKIVHFMKCTLWGKYYEVF